MYPIESIGPQSFFEAPSVGSRIFLPDAASRRPVLSGDETFRSDPHWKRLTLFHEYFHGDTGQGLGASHQTGWTGLVAKLLDELG